MVDPLPRLRRRQRRRKSCRKRRRQHRRNPSVPQTLRSLPLISFVSPVKQTAEHIQQTTEQEQQGN